MPASREPVTVDAGRIEGVGEFEITARGAAEITQGDLNIFGESLRFNQELGTVEADGGARLRTPTDRIFGPRLRYNTLDDTGSVEQPQFLLQRDVTARGHAERLEFLGKDRYRLKNAVFTTCERGNDDWQLEAKELELDYGIEEGRADTPRLRFYDFTILAAPYASFPLENRRKSGVLAPYYAHSSTRGFEIGVPFYWNIAPEYDLTVTPVNMSKRGLMLRNQGRYLGRSYVGDLKLEYMPGDEELNRDRYGVSFDHKQALAPGLSLVIDYNRVSDDRYFVDLSSQVRQSSIGNLAQDAYVTQGGKFGGMAYSAQLRVQKFQTLQDPLAPTVPPYHRVPQLSLTATRNDVGGFLDTAWPFELVRFQHTTLQQGQRFIANPTFSAPVLSPGTFLIPKAGFRYVGYDLDNPPPGNSGRPAAGIPWFSVDSGLVFDRSQAAFGNNLTQTLEPRLFYVYIPYRNQDTAPLFDTALADFNLPQLFTENRFTGGDRFGDANQLTSALTTRLLQPGGQELLRATVGQINYFTAERVGLTPTSTLRTYHTSDLYASIGGRPVPSTIFDATTQYNRRDDIMQRYAVSARYAPEVAKALTAGYRVNRSTGERQVDVSGQWPLLRGWYAIGRYNYSVNDRLLLDGVAGLEFNAGCWVFRAAAQRIQAAAQTSNTTFFVQLEFTGIGQVGNEEIVTMLRRNVPGYSITNPTDPTLAPPSARRPLPFPQVY
jgi:LPS-assembly protein